MPKAICTLEVQFLPACLALWTTPLVYTTVKWFQKHSVLTYNSNHVLIAYTNYNWVVQNGTSNQLVVDNNASQSVIINTTSLSGPFKAHNHFQYYYELWDGATYVGTSDTFEIDMQYVQYNNGYATPYSGLCDDDIIKVDAPYMAGQHVDWYMDETRCTANGGTVLPPCVSFPNANKLIAQNTYSLNYAVKGGYEYKIWYKVYPAITNNCATQYQSGDIVVRVPHKLEIYESGKNATGATLEMDNTVFGGNINGRYPNYRNFQWFRNNIAIPNANTITYFATLPGSYYMAAQSDCGTRTSNILKYGCGSPAPWTQFTSYTNYTFTASQVITGNVILSGGIAINPNITVEFKNGVAMMDNNCSVIYVNRGNNGMNGATLKLTNMNVVGCTMWSGIGVFGEYSLPATSNVNGKIIMDNSSIQDAIAGLSMYGGGKCQISNNSSFVNNKFHIINQGNTISTINNTLFSYLSNANNTCQYPIFDPLLSTSRGVHVCSKTGYGPVITSSTFDNQNNYTGNTTNAIELYDINPALASNHAIDISSCTFIGPFDEMVHAENCDYVKVSNSSFDYMGNATASYGIYGINSKGWELQNNTFAQNHPPQNGMAFNTGIYLKNVTDGGLIRLNTINRCTYGVEYYQSNVVNTSSYFTRNTVNNSSYGIIVAQSENPLGATAGNTSANEIKLRMRCNEFYTNDGIVGSGNLITQEYGIGNGDDWGNIFSTSRFDLAWQNSGANGYTLPSIYYNSQNPPNTDLNYNLPANSSVLLNNTPVTKNNWINNLTMTKFQNNAANCNSLRPVFSNNFGQKDTNELFSDYSIIPNPAKEHIVVGGNYEGGVSIIIYDIAGKIIQLNNVYDISVGKLIPIEHIPQGLYIIVLKSTEGELLHKQKLLVTE